MTKQLNSIDIKILKYISKFDEVSEKEIIKHFPKVKSIDIRLSKLADKKIKSEGISPIVHITEQSYIDKIYKKNQKPNGAIQRSYTGNYKINEYGREFLQNYKTHLNDERKIFYTRNIITPIIVTIITTGIIELAKWFFLK